MKQISYILSSYLRVDLRTLGIFRFVFGLVCFIDIYRRFQYIEVFYSDRGIAPLGLTSGNSFSLLSALQLGSVEAVTIFFYLALLFSFFFMVGYKTKFSQVIMVITLLSIHNRLIIVENGGDFVVNAFLVWSVFLPLGKRFSVDRLFYSLRYFKDSTPTSLNSGSLIASNEPKNYWGLAYLACILQLSIIYFFNFVNKSSGTWQDGSSLYYFYKLDVFLTPIGNFIKEFSLMPMWLSKILTGMTLQLEFWVPLLLIVPVYTLWLRRFSMVSMIGFHIIIGLSMNIGAFSWVMISVLLLLLSARDIDLLRGYLSRLSSGPFTAFYDSDCGFCHQTARIIRRMDLFENITWAGKDWKEERPESLERLADSTIVLWDKNNNRVYTRHEAFSRIVSSLPFGFLFAWLFMVPGLSHLLGYIYDIVSGNRTSISNLFGYSACDIPKEHNENVFAPTYSRSPYQRGFNIAAETLKTIAVALLLVGVVNYAFAKCYQKTKNTTFKNSVENIKFFKTFNSGSSAYKFIKHTRMIQNWNMFYSVPRSYKWIIVEATLSDRDGIYNEGEEFIDRGNGIYDQGEEFVDIGNGKWDKGETFTDRNTVPMSQEDAKKLTINEFEDKDNNGIYDIIEKLKAGNGIYDRGEEFVDIGNGIYDRGEEFVDIGNGIYDEGESFTDKQTVIDFFTGEPPNYDALNYDTFKKIDNSQFWRKFIYRIDPYNKNGDSYYKYRGRLVELIKKKNNLFWSSGDFNNDGQVNDRDKVQSVSLIKLNHSIKTGKVNTTDISMWKEKRKTKSNRKKNNLKNLKNKRPAPGKRSK
jgi:predicted DCC family thiol-disulfide oxidoreductase YuxK